jgi:hypothetical protein
MTARFGAVAEFPCSITSGVIGFIRARCDKGGVNQDVSDGEQK